jgi:hypothetical protein
MKRKPWINRYFFKLRIRLAVAYKILFRKYDHWAILNVDQENFVKMVKEEPFNVDISYHGVQPYGVHQIVRAVAKSKDEIDIILDKAQFEADAIEYITKKKP